MDGDKYLQLVACLLLGLLGWLAPWKRHLCAGCQGSSLTDQPNWGLHFGWQKFGLIRSPLGSAFHLGKLGGPEHLKRQQPLSQHPLPDQISKEVANMVFPAPHHDFPGHMVFPVFIHIKIHMKKYFRSHQIQKTNKQKNPGTNGEWKNPWKNWAGHWSIIH